MLFLYILFTIVLPFALSLGFYKNYFKKNLTALFLSLLSAPIVSALTLNLIFAVFPGLQPNWYLLVFLGINSAFIWVFRFQLKSAAVFSKKALNLLKQKKKWTFFLVTAATVGYFALLCLIALKTPFYENDGLEYAISARQIYIEKSTTNYPYINSEKTEGYYGPWSHPPAYPLLIVADYLISHDVYSNNFRIISVYLLALLAAFNILFFRRNAAGIFTFFLTATTGLLLLKAVSGHIELLRITGFCLPIISFFFDKNFLQNRKSILTNGIVTGLALYTHSLALISPFLVGVYFLFFGGSHSQTKIKRILGLASVNIIALVPVIPQLIANMKKFGLPVADTGAVPLYQIPSLNYTFYFDYMRGIFSILDKGVSLFRGFLNFNFFSISHWLGLFILVYLWRAKVTIRSKFLEIVALFYFIVLAFTLAGSNSFIKNDRYIFTIAPLLFYAASDFFNRFDQQQIRKVCIFMALGLLFNLTYAQKQISYHFWRYPSILQSQDNNLARIKNSTIGSHELINFILENIPRETKILAFRQGDFSYYLPHFVYSHLDHTLVDLFTAPTTDEALSILEKKEIKYLITPYYPEPAIYSSRIDKIISDPSLTQIAFQSGGYTLYQILPRPVKLDLVKEYVVNPTTTFWTSKGDTEFFQVKKRVLKKIRPYYAKKVTLLPTTNPITSESENILNRSTRLFTRTVIGEDSPSTFKQVEYITVEANGEYIVKIEFGGYGQIAPLVYEYAVNEIVSREVMSSKIYENQVHHEIAGRFIVSPKISRIRVGIQTGFPAEININKIQIFKIN